MTETTRERIIDSAERLLGAKGYHSTSVQEIASAVGVRSGLVFYYFSSKEQLLFEVMYRSIVSLHEAVSYVGSTDLNGLAKTAVVLIMRVNKGVNGPATSLLSHHNLLKDVFTPDHREQYLELRHHTSLLMRSFVEQGLEEGVIDVADPVLAALAVIGLADSVRNWFRPDGSRSLDEIAEQTANLAIKLLRPTDAPALTLRELIPPGRARELATALDQRVKSRYRFWGSIDALEPVAGRR